MFVIFDDIALNMLSNKKLNLVVPELFIRGGKLNICLVMTQSNFTVPKNIGLNSTDYFIVKINKQELLFTLKALWIFTKKVLQNHGLFLVINTTVATNNHLCFKVFWKEYKN